MNPSYRKPKQPRKPKKNERPVVVASYFKMGKRVTGYKRRKAGEG